MLRLLLQSASVVLMLSVGMVLSMVAPAQVVPPVPIEVSELPFPTVGPESVAVSLRASIDLDGRVSAIQPMDTAGSTVGAIRYTGTLVGYDQTSLDVLKRWKFVPAIDSSTKKPVASSASVTFIYQRKMGLEDLPTLKSNNPSKSDYVPPILTRARPLPQYPLNTTGVKTVVMLLDVRENGSVASVRNIRSVPLLDEASSLAVKSWSFEPARYLGKPVPSTATVAIAYMYIEIQNNN